MATYTDVNTPVISKITLPSGNTYYIADREIRNVVQELSETVAGGISFNIVWTQSQYSSTTAPTVTTLSQIPAGVKVYYNNGSSNATGTLAASANTKGTFYLIYSESQVGGSDHFDEYATITTGTNTYTWEKIGDTVVDLSNVIQSVTLNKQADVVLGESTTFKLTSGTVTHGTPTTDTFVKSVTAETDKNLVTTTITGVNSETTTASKATAATTQTTAIGTGTTSTTNTDWLKGVSVTNETLTIGAATMNTQNTTQFTFDDVTVPIKNSVATTVATGATSTSGTGDPVVTGVNIGSSASAITAMPTSTVGTAITVGINDKVTALTNSTTITTN